MPTIEHDERFANHRDKAVELFARKGFAQVGMRELATCLGLAPGSLYHHYPSKRHLLLDILEEFYEELMAALASVDSRGAVSIGDVIRAHVKLHQELPRHFSIALRDSGCLSVEQQQRVEHLRAQYERQLLDLMYRPRLQGAEVSVTFVCIIASLPGIVHSWFSAQRLEGSATSRLMEVALVGAIERLLA
ncbi:TetR/AcrR family transcriptional regulator [Pseudomonas fluorescens]|uniref:TetR/AcrR family transcriptional regulator n=1 Tax=Pseudomonas fluorescens TaxID=294 RepID=A0A7Z6MS74_PSEFL|nr:TetR/AcrR family transcriptional regulator [Pseudomonas fluorescens]RDS87384.1 TetR/AcrR family transcriptional regulator [Pseudomonas fluorescens]